ncbi:response regulator [Paenibacillus aceris]|uniref:Two-component system response regulator YesN n=1 Tax=Paenibacillus aceris TaxID=869555 RepID=A0ABS4I7D8_9BACL|nr:response regulator [Paenibacillus aceris]MBP1966743.1 two-component system response regulator YesN [Paenibacillus aceris]NHW35005.1 response regulator [Paenibacillus aceris]
MKKVLLVDDEILIRETIRDTIQWEKEGFIYCGDASDGEVALPMIEQYQPDILITDIKMPFMDGLELSSFVRKNMPDVKIVILSGHGDFEYARTALRLGVEEYCTKPISSADLVQTLRQVSDKIDDERRAKEQIEQLKQGESRHAGLTQSKLLNDLCSGFITTSEAVHLSSKLSLNLLSRYYVVVTADFRKMASADSVPDDIFDYMKQDEHKLNLKLEGDNILVFKRSKTECVWILKRESPEHIKQALETFQHVQNQTTDQLPYSISIGIGSVQDRMQGIHVSFLEAMEDMHWRRLSRQNRQAMLESRNGSFEQSVFLDRAQFVDFLKIGSPAKAESFVRTFASVLQHTDWHSSLIGYYILNDLTLEVFRSARDSYPNIANFDTTLHTMQNAIESIRSWDESCAYLIGLSEQYWQWRSGASDKYGDMLVKVKKYIHDHYDKDYFSLQDAADHVNLSPGHLSKVFSQEIGQTFIEYLTQTRIRKAMELLQTTQAKSYEIAFLVGYNDAHYFSNLFKRVTGMTTKQFRKSGQLNKDLPTSEREEHKGFVSYS